MFRNVGVWLILGLLAAMAFLCLSQRAPAIEADLQQQSRIAISGAGYSGVEVAADGREISLLAPAVYRSHTDELKQEVSGIRGVRSVAVRFLPTVPAAEPEPQQPKPAAPVRSAPETLQTQLREMVSQQSVEFESGSNRLTVASKQLLDRIANLITNRADLSIEVAGHTDGTGNADANLRLSRDRAQAVVDYLVGRKVPRRILKAAGYGESEPIAANDTAVGRRRNRRVEFNITSNSTGD